MADSYLQLPPDGSGKSLDAEQLTVGANTVYRERDQIVGRSADDIMVVVDTDPDEADHGAVVRVAPPVSPAFDHDSAVVSSGSTATIDLVAIPSGKTAKLFSALVGSTVACKFELQKRDGAVVTTFAVLFTGGLASQPNQTYRPRHKNVVTLPYGDGDENWRVVVTNLDQHAADAYVTLEWDEVG